eukprot:c17965_g1_i3.p1 GENE.c17965_g1_i3~~c17965_g1_i3.p1  ORF type:complete len:152 (+),score=31.72 c17965_g1_i3:40-495(+)
MFILLVIIFLQHNCILSFDRQEDYKVKTYNCDIYKECTSCIQDMNCGWCGVENYCVEKIAIKQNNNNISCNSFESSFCSAMVCEMYKSCFGCTNDPFCGWCSLTAMCLSKHGNKSVHFSCGYGFIVSESKCGNQQTGFQGSGMKFMRIPKF